MGETSLVIFQCPCIYVCSVIQSSLTLCNCMDYSPPGFSVYRIFQARILELLPFPSPGDLPDPGIKPASLLSPALAGRVFTTSTTWEAPVYIYFLKEQRSIQRRQWQPTPVLLPGKSHGQRRLVGCSPWGREELDTTELLHFHFSLSCIGEGKGNPLQYSCLENPRDSRAW